MVAVIFGATSILGQKLAHVYAERDFDVVVVGRDEQETQTIAADVNVRTGART